MKGFLVLLVICAVATAKKSHLKFIAKPITDYPEVWGSFVAPDEETSSYIVGGIPAGTHQFPFHVGVVSELQFGDALCSGSLISRQSVLTSAICVSGARTVMLHLGARDMTAQERYQVQLRVPSSNIRIHPNFVRLHRILRFDIAIVRMVHALAFLPSGINVINLPSSADMTNDFSHEEAIIMGFGRTSPNKLENSYINQYSRVSTMTNAQCSQRTHFIAIENQHVCVSGDEGRSICTGSLGGPLVIERNGQRVQIGVASFYTGECGRNDPSGFTRIAYRPIYDWIRANM